ncbi:MAG: recombinase family protein [Endomicrobiaceae bacterium]|jgi:site-specific DNA recombinase|nr:recombinase family protein [Endomicrobiaceae bacterium]MDD3730396.1 recombinase family protein [Endomicrobiaceae bacterium]
MEWQIVLWSKTMSFTESNNTDSNKPMVKCAIYTRKSSEEGLDLEFNSLDAQREACEAYIKSQKHEGWQLVDKHYNDGGYSGGTLERPALKELLNDISLGNVNIIIVYKIDRLTRSLMDFSKIVEVLDKNQTSFVSITQQFNTTTSMGRLTLNMLLSFAQFEREVTGERIRDKYAASKQKGMWMGGVAPIGYYREDKKLYPDLKEAGKVKRIFEKYIELKTVHRLKEYLDNNNILSRIGKKFSKGILYKILSNRVYIGEVPHKDKWYKGLHEAVIDLELFSNVQNLLKENNLNAKSIKHCKTGSLLSGKIFDDKNNYMSPAHSNKNGKRYRYYISQAVIQHDRERIGIIAKIPAGEIESFVTNVIKELLSDKETMQSLLKELAVNIQKTIITETVDINLSSDILRSIISKIKVFKEKVKISYYPEQLKELLLSNYEKREFKEVNNKTETTIIKNIKIAVVDNGSKIIIGADSTNKPNEVLINALLKGYKWNKLLVERKVKNIQEICTTEKVTSRYVKDLLELSYLSPKIQESIIKGTQSQDLTLIKLKSITTSDWKEQEKILNI